MKPVANGRNIRHDLLLAEKYQARLEPIEKETRTMIENVAGFWGVEFSASDSNPVIIEKIRALIKDD